MKQVVIIYICSVLAFIAGLLIGMDLSADKVKVKITFNERRDKVEDEDTSN